MIIFFFSVVLDAHQLLKLEIHLAAGIVAVEVEKYLKRDSFHRVRNLISVRFAEADYLKFMNERMPQFRVYLVLNVEYTFSPLNRNINITIINSVDTRPTDSPASQQPSTCIHTHIHKHTQSYTLSCTAQIFQINGRVLVRLPLCLSSALLSVSFAMHLKSHSNENPNSFRYISVFTISLNTLRFVCCVACCLLLLMWLVFSPAII